MSYNFPNATKTRKLQSLSGPLRDIAEELIAKKFNIGEVVERSAPTPSQSSSRAVRPEDAPYGTGYAGSFGDGRHGYSIHDSREHRTITFECTSEQAIVQAFRSLDYAGIRSKNRRIVVGQAGFHALRQIPAMTSYDRVEQRPDMSMPQIAEIYGVPIFYDKSIDYDFRGSSMGRMEGWN